MDGCGMNGMKPDHSLEHYGLFIDGKWQTSQANNTVNSPYSGKSLAEVAQASAKQLEEVLESAHQGFEVFRQTSRYARAQLLLGIAGEIEKRRGALRERIINEAAKPYTMADAEVSRAINTFSIDA